MHRAVRRGPPALTVTLSSWTWAGGARGRGALCCMRALGRYATHLSVGTVRRAALASPAAGRHPLSRVPVAPPRPLPGRSRCCCTSPLAEPRVCRWRRDGAAPPSSPPPPPPLPPTLPSSLPPVLPPPPHCYRDAISATSRRTSAGRCRVASGRVFRSRGHASSPCNPPLVLCIWHAALTFSARHCGHRAGTLLDWVWFGPAFVPCRRAS